MPFARQVSIGRVALIQFPEAEAGKLVVISDVVSPGAVRWERLKGFRGAAEWKGPLRASCSALEGLLRMQAAFRHARQQ